MATFIEHNAPVIHEFRTNEWRVKDRKFPVLLLTTIGAKTGQKRVSPMAYLQANDTLYVFASRGRAHRHPHWYLNLVANHQVSVEVGCEAYEATATPLSGKEHDRIYAKQASRFSQLGDYQQKTDRIIPVVALVRKQ